MRYGIHATVRLDQNVWQWVSGEARKHVDWCRQFGIGVDLEDAVGDVIDTEIEGFASRDWAKFSLACRLVGFHDFTVNFCGDRTSVNEEGGRSVEIVFRPSLSAWLFRQADGNELSDVVNGILANARMVDWDTYQVVEEMSGDPDYFLREDGPPESAIEACEKLLAARDEVDSTDR